MVDPRRSAAAKRAWEKIRAKGGRKVVGFYTRKVKGERKVVPITIRSRRPRWRWSWGSRLDWILGERPKPKWERIRPEEEKPVERGGYVTDGGVCPALHPTKVEQREDLLRQLPRRGTFIELYAGRGNLTKALYQGKGTKFFLIDKDPNALAAARRRLQNERKYVIRRVDNLDWIREGMEDEKLGDVAFVDFDAFGSPGEAVQAFFENYNIKRPMLVALTDGSGKYFRLTPDPGKKEATTRKLYGLRRRPDGSLKEMKRLLDDFMESQGEKHAAADASARSEPRGIPELRR